MKIKPKRIFTASGASSFLVRSLMLFCLLFLAGNISLYAQTKTVSGVVTDAAKEPLIGVSVKIQGTTTGTITDIDGNYTLSAKSGDVLEFSFVGMKPQLITIGSQNIVNVILEDDAKLLNETVVIGYGSAKKADLTGSIGSVNSEAILKQPALNPLQSVQGKMAGVNIINNDAPGSTPSVTIRGTGTALGGRKPLYIVDGFPVDDIKNISASDIVSMDVLKDAASAAIYGLRAANGVIMITTKRGKSGQSKIGVESYIGVKTVLNKVKMANASQYIEYFNENQNMLKEHGIDDTYNLADVALQQYNTDWYDELIKTGITTNNVVSLQGGGNVIDYYLSYNYYDESGILDGQNFQRTTIRNNNLYKFYDDRLRFTQTLNISFSNERKKPLGAFNEAYRQSPLVPVQYANGAYGRPFVNKTTGIVGYDGAATDNIGALNSIGNPMYSVNAANEKEKTVTIQGGFEGEFKITDFLKVNSRFGGTKWYLKNRQFSDIKGAWLNTDPRRTDAEFIALKEKNPTSLTYANNSLLLTDEDTYRWTWEGFATFNKDFDNHHVELVAGLSREKQGVGTKSTMTGYDVPTKSQYWSINHASGAYATQTTQYYRTPRTLASYFGRAQYNYDNKYYLSAVIRRDGSSTFKMNNDYWGTFPSVGLGWTISKEDFMKNIEFLNYLKLRGTWGELGNQEVPLNVSQIFTNNASATQNYVLGNDQHIVYGASFGSPAVPVTWEVTRETSLGFDFSMLNDRLTGSFDYYNKINTNTVLKVNPTLNSMYEGEFYTHGAKVRNRGVEIALGWSDKLPNGITYDISANYSYNKNRVMDVYPAYNGAQGGSLNDGQITKRLQEGQPLYAWWMYEVEGVWQTQEEIDANPHIGTPYPGYLRYKDQNGDGVIDSRDRKYMGSYVPTSNYGLHIGVGYKNFDFNIDGYGVAGNKVYNGLKHGRIDGGENITYDTYKDRWRGPGTSNTNPGATRDTNPSDYFLESGAFFRINNITLGYTFNDLVLPGSKLRVYATAQNPFMFTGYSGFSPEISSDGDPTGTTGIELSAYPTTRNFLFGLNLQF